MRRFNQHCLTALMALLLCVLFCQQSLAEDEQGLFWAIESGGEATGYLLGTIHSEDPRVLEFTDQFIAALSGSDRFAMELVPNLPTLARLATRMNLAAGEELSSIIGAERFEAVATALATHGIPRAMVSRMKPWAAMITLSVPAPETGFFMDFSLSLRASGNGLEVIGLETLDEQLSFLENMPLEHQLDMLDQAVQEYSQLGEIHAQMVETYLAGDLAALQSYTEDQLSELGDAGEYFISAGIEARNRRMIGRLVEALGSGTVFAAVGALHLPGEQGLIKLLRQEGYSLRPLASPFPE